MEEIYLENLPSRFENDGCHVLEAPVFANYDR